MSPALGMAGPMSNYAVPPQWVESVPYRWGKRSPSGKVEPEAVDRFAKEFREKNYKKWIEVERLGGFCLLLKRDVWKKVEPEIDKWTDLSLFDTDILSTKAKHVGYMLGCCRDLFIHHFGTRVFAHGSGKEEKKGKLSWAPTNN
jgi:GT2 family glycosyltransferase